VGHTACTQPQCLCKGALYLYLYCKYCDCTLWAADSGLQSKGKVHRRTGDEGPQGKYRYSPTLSLTSALDGVGGQCHALAALPPGKTRYPLYRRLGGPQGWSGWVQNISNRPGFDPRTVQPIASRYTDRAIPALWFAE